MKKIKILTTSFLIALLFVCFRVGFISVIQNNRLSQMASAQRIAQKEIKQWRGCIYDCNMIPFCDRSESRVDVYNGSVPVVARYHDNGIARHIMGYVRSDGTGVSGIEGAFDKILTSDKKSYARYVRDAVGNAVLNNYATKNYNYIPQCNIKTTLDYKIQKIAENAATNHIKNGAVVILDIQNFDIKAMVSRPQYNQTDIASNMQDDGSPLLNKALCSYNAGSIFKIITTAAALESEYNIDVICNGSIDIDGICFLCHKQDGHGNINFKTAFAKSCNVFFYNAGQQAGTVSIIQMAHRFGLGNKVINTPLEETSGSIPYRSNYSPRENANISIGQGEVLVTPVQAAYITAVIANDGIARSVNVADSIVGADGEVLRTIRKDKSNVVISKEIAVTIGDMMRECVLEGTAQGVQNGIVAVAGKTGSAETGWSDSNGEMMVHGWFCGFFPYENPKYAMAVFCENGKSGSASCIEPFREIVLAINDMEN